MIYSIALCPYTDIRLTKNNVLQARGINGNIWYLDLKDIENLGAGSFIFLLNILQNNSLSGQNGFGQAADLYFRSIREKYCRSILFIGLKLFQDPSLKTVLDSETLHWRLFHIDSSIVMDSLNHNDSWNEMNYVYQIDSSKIAGLGLGSIVHCQAGNCCWNINSLSILYAPYVAGIQLPDQALMWVDYSKAVALLSKTESDFMSDLFNQFMIAKLNKNEFSDP